MTLGPSEKLLLNQSIDHQVSGLKTLHSLHTKTRTYKDVVQKEQQNVTYDGQCLNNAMKKEKAVASLNISYIYVIILSNGVWLTFVFCWTVAFLLSFTFPKYRKN